MHIILPVTAVFVWFWPWYLFVDRPKLRSVRSSCAVTKSPPQLHSISWQWRERQHRYELRDCSDVTWVSWASYDISSDDNVMYTANVIAKSLRKLRIITAGIYARMTSLLRLNVIATSPTSLDITDSHDRHIPNMIMSSLRQNALATSFWYNNEINMLGRCLWLNCVSNLGFVGALMLLWHRVIYTWHDYDYSTLTTLQMNKANPT